MAKQCRECSGDLEYIKSNPHMGCGAIYYYQCSQCESFFAIGNVGFAGLPVHKKIEVSTTEEREEFISHSMEGY